MEDEHFNRVTNRFFQYAQDQRIFILKEKKEQDQNLLRIRCRTICEHLVNSLLVWCCTIGEHFVKSLRILSRFIVEHFEICFVSVLALLMNLNFSNGSLLIRKQIHVKRSLLQSSGPPNEATGNSFENRTFFLLEVHSSFAYTYVTHIHIRMYVCTNPAIQSFATDRDRSHLYVSIFCRFVEYVSEIHFLNSLAKFRWTFYEGFVKVHFSLICVSLTYLRANHKWIFGKAFELCGLKYKIN